jgi:hypothetical protein
MFEAFVVSVVADAAKLTPLVFVITSDPELLRVASPPIVCGEYAVPPALPTGTCPALGTVELPLPPCAAPSVPLICENE